MVARFGHCVNARNVLCPIQNQVPQKVERSTYNFHVADLGMVSKFKHWNVILRWCALYISVSMNDNKCKKYPHQTLRFWPTRTRRALDRKPKPLPQCPSLVDELSFVNQQLIQYKWCHTVASHAYCIDTVTSVRRMPTLISLASSKLA